MSWMVCLVGVLSFIEIAGKRVALPLFEMISNSSAESPVSADIFKHGIFFISPRIVNRSQGHP